MQDALGTLSVLGRLLDLGSCPVCGQLADGYDHTPRPSEADCFSDHRIDWFGHPVDLGNQRVPRRWDCLDLRKTKSRS